MADHKSPVLFLELSERRKSGFVQLGTEGTPFHAELDVAENFWIPASGFMSKKVMEMVDGKETEVTKNVEIRWIQHCDEIEVIKQKQMGISPNPKEDKIRFTKGIATVVREGATLSLYDYLKHVYYNEDSPGRSRNAAKLFRIIQLDKKAEYDIESKKILADAINTVASLTFKKGDIYQYNEDRITALCSLFQIYGETWSTKVRALMAHAESNPKWFMEQVSKFEQVIETEVLHALELHVIKFDGNVAVYMNEDKVLKNLGSGNLSHQTKIQRLADYLKTKEGSSDLTELRSKIELAKQKI